MGWFGKIAGGTIGFIIGGPFGAAGGAYIGHKLFDTGKGIHLTRHEEVQANYFVALFSMLGKMAKSDGVVTPDEIRKVEEVIRTNLRLNDEQRKFAIKIFNEAKDSSYTFEDFANNFYNINRNEPNMLRFMLNSLFEVAKADGILHENEDKLLQSAKNIFRISDSEYNTFRKRHFPHAENEKYYAVLNCSVNSSNDDIKSSYRKLVQEYHPDKITNKGLPEEFKQFAKVKFQEIQDAYDYIKELRGF